MSKRGSVEVTHVWERLESQASIEVKARKANLFVIAIQALAMRMEDNNEWLNLS